MKISWLKKQLQYFRAKDFWYGGLWAFTTGLVLTFNAWLYWAIGFTEKFRWDIPLLGMMVPIFLCTILPYLHRKRFPTSDPWKDDDRNRGEWLM
jgi:hypothetical protein